LWVGEFSVTKQWTLTCLANDERPATNDDKHPASPHRLQSVLVPMDTARIAALLKPYLDRELSVRQLQDISTYIDILFKWNARINLTAIRNPEEIVTRHFGESLFLARHLFPQTQPDPIRVIDLGSGAGFPGLPLKIWAPQIHLTLVESNQKKATFLREVSRALTLTNINVYAARAETLFIPKRSIIPEESPTPERSPNRERSQIRAKSQTSADLVTFRAIEKFDQVLPLAAGLMSPSGCLAVLIGSSQLANLRTLPNLTWESHPIPDSESRLLAIGGIALKSGK
jgi:16S rRNA (guanine(527)-N(7))-methyltransferase RsmG